MTGSPFSTDSRTKPSGAVVGSLFAPDQKPPPWIQTMTGSRSSALVPFGRATFRFRQSSDTSVISPRTKGTKPSPRGWGHAGPYDWALTVLPASGTCNLGGLKRFSPPVSSP